MGGGQGLPQGERAPTIVINGVITSISRIMTPGKPIYKTIFRGYNL